jgi:hypothetical protein
MKSKGLIALLTAVTGLGFAAEPMTLSSPAPQVRGFDAQKEYNRWRSYVCLGLSHSRPSDSSRVLPDVGAGVRFALPLGTLDLYASYTGDNPFTSKEKTFFYTAPRASYMLYLSPERNQSFYGGLGLAFGGLKTKDQTTFHGMIPSVSLGYEMNRLQRLSNFFQLDVSQPALATSWTKPFVDTVSWDLGPVVQFSAGCGF